MHPRDKWSKSILRRATIYEPGLRTPSSTRTEAVCLQYVRTYLHTVYRVWSLSLSRLRQDLSTGQPKYEGS